MTCARRALTSVVIAWLVTAPAVAAGGALPRLPAFELENWDGRSVGLDTLAGTTAIVAFTYAKCIFACPMLTFELVQLDEALGRPAAVRYLHISVNPEADTAEEIRLHFEKHGIDAVADPRWLFLHRPAAGIRKLLDEAGIVVRRTRVPEGELIDHTIRVWVLGPDGDTMAVFDTYQWDEEDMLHAVRRALPAG